MIRIVRAATPSVLLTSSSPTRYKDAKVIEALWVMQHEKCCYCEGYIPVSGAAKEVELPATVKVSGPCERLEQPTLSLQGLQQQEASQLSNHNERRPTPTRPIRPAN